MYLKALRVRGFKSFAQRVELRFEPGVSVVVGPNGSGKSNIADALLWGMASPTPGQLRASAPRDVLFAGSDGRPPAGVCEVELVLDNADGALPIELAEVSVLRRLDRDGEGEYLLNRARVRRLDVVELLAETGLGREMHSVIGQGRVEEILLSRPAERRRFVEEAAGLGRYQQRRARAQAKLARVASELERAHDLEREVRARLRPLEAQAGAAERAAALRLELGGARLTLALSDLLGEVERRDGAERRLAEAAGCQDAVERRAAERAVAREAHERRLAEAAADHERATRAAYALDGARAQLAPACARLLRATEALERARERLAGRAAEGRAAAERLQQERDALVAAAAGMAEELRQLGDGSDPALAAAQAAATAAGDAALAARTALADAEGALASAERESAASAERADRLEARNAEAEAALDRLAQEADGAAAAADEASAVARAAREGLAAAERRRTEAVDREEHRRAAAREAAARAATLDEELALARVRLQALEAAVEAGEGLTPAARELAGRGAAPVAAALDVEPGFERAAAAALGRLAGAVAAEDLPAALRLIESASGDAAIVLRDASAGAAPPAGARALSDVVRVGDAALRRLVAGVALVEDLSEVREGIAVTAEGLGIDAERGIVWRAAESGEAAWLALAADLRASRAAIVPLEREASAGREASAVASQALAGATAARATADEARRAAQEALASAEQEERRRSRDLARLEDERVRVASSGEHARAELEAARRARDEAASALSQDRREVERRRAAASAAREAHARAEARRAELADAAALRAAQRSALGERLRRTHEDASRLASEAAERQGSSERDEAAAAARVALAHGAEPLAADAQSCEARAADLLAPAQGRAAELAALRDRLSSELARDARDDAALAAAGREAAAELAGAQVALAHAQDRVGELERRRDELSAAGATAAPLEAPLEAERAEAVAARAERLERRLEAMGPVNPLAAREYEEERARADDLSVQCDDLERSLRELRGLIRELGETIDRRFDETFGQVARNFEEVAGTLFPGGRGRLRLVAAEAPVPIGEADDGGEDEAPERPEPGIELEVKPAGKRVMPLGLLSGGEKSLAAIAFLFALFLARPSPFYLLDEVEAALDDANIDRFLGLLRRYRERAQFIVITHQRRTMEVADTLYGVTMGADGESRVLSRRMARDGDALGAAS